jgi:hypothetical protein
MDKLKYPYEDKTWSAKRKFRLVGEYEDFVKTQTGKSFREYRKEPGIDNSFLELSICRYFTGEFGNEQGMRRAKIVCQELGIARTRFTFYDGNV